MDIADYDVNTTTYEAKYRGGYGLNYPDGHVIRVHRQILDYELKMTGGTMLDYGCGTGTHLEYFHANGFTPYGCDISETAIEECRRRMPEFAENFHVVPNAPRLRDLYPMELDIVFSNQVLYYLTDSDLDDMLTQFHEMLRPDGVIIATMMAPTSYYHAFVTGESDGGLSRVELKGRLNETTYINFMTRDEVIDLFTRAGFRKLHCGSYSWIIREEEGPTDHCIFVGMKG